MKIHSKFKDYYDHVVPPSDTVLWCRKGHDFVLDAHKQLPINKVTIEFLIDSFGKMPHPPITYKPGYKGILRSHTDVIMLGFCGKLYAVYLLYQQRNNKTCIKAATDIMEFIEIYNSSKNPTINLEKNRIWDKRFPYNEQGIKNWYQEVNQTQKVGDIFITIKAPIFLMKQHYGRGSIEFHINPNMSEYGLQRIFDPWTAYQEIEMYLTNTLAVGVETIPIFSDELKRDAHGFDNWSFKQIGPKPRKEH